MSTVRPLSGAFADLARYDFSLQREWLATQRVFDLEGTRAHEAPLAVTYPPAGAMALSEDEFKARDRWQSLFMPRGALVAARTDQKHWLTFGVNPTLPVLVRRNPVLMSDDASEAVVRVGVYREMSSKAWAALTQTDDDGAKPVTRSIGWSSLPERQELLVRMSGLLWPEASQRLANSALLTRESKVSGQIILFAVRPNFRGATRGTNRLLLNAIVYGPGLGTSRVIEPR